MCAQSTRKGTRKVVVEKDPAQYYVGLSWSVDIASSNEAAITVVTIASQGCIEWSMHNTFWGLCMAYRMIHPDDDTHSHLRNGGMEMQKAPIQNDAMGVLLWLESCRVLLSPVEWGKNGRMHPSKWGQQHTNSYISWRLVDWLSGREPEKELLDRFLHECMWSCFEAWKDEGNKQKPGGHHKCDTCGCDPLVSYLNKSFDFSMCVMWCLSSQ